MRRLRNVAPWSANSRTTAIPAKTVYQVKRSPKSPTKFPSEESGTPPSRLESAIPQMSGAPNEAIVFAHVQTPRQRGLSALPRHSKDTTRTIRRTRIKSRAR